jgi:hypothetical protein
MSNSFQSEPSSESAVSLPQHRTGTPAKIYYPAGFNTIYQVGLELNGTQGLLFHSTGVNLVGENVNTIPHRKCINN